MTPTAGDPNAFPVTFTIPDDGVDARSALSVNVGFVALADRTAWLKARLDPLRVLPALNFSFGVTLTNCQHACWSDVERKWWTVGDPTNADVLKTFVNVVGGDAATLISGGQLTGGHLHMVEVDPAGNALVTVESNQTTYLEYNQPTATWTKRTHGFAAPGAAPPIVYDPISAHWIYVGSDPSTALLRFSSNRTTWSAGGTFALGAGGFDLCRAGVNKTSGSVVIAAGPTGYNAGQQSVRMVRSTDGGVNVTLVQTIVSGLSGVDKIDHPKYNATDSHWLLPLWKTTGGTASEIWSSADDGVTWTLACALANTAIKWVVPFGEFWIGLTTAGDVVFSFNSGVSWQFSSAKIPTTARGLFTSPYGLLSLDGATAWPSFRTGLNGGVVT